MITVEVSAKLTVDDLIAAVEQLPSAELTEFTRRAIAIQSRRGVPLLLDEEEQVLLEAIKSQPLNHQAQEQLDLLREKSREGTLTPAEQAQLLGFIQQVERQDLARVEMLITLAHKRGMTVSALMDELGLATSHA